MNTLSIINFRCGEMILHQLVLLFMRLTLFSPSPDKLAWKCDLILTAQSVDCRSTIDLVVMCLFFQLKGKESVHFDLFSWMGSLEYMFIYVILPLAGMIHVSSCWSSWMKVRVWLKCLSGICQGVSGYPYIVSFINDVAVDVSGIPGNCWRLMIRSNRK